MQNNGSNAVQTGIWDSYYIDPDDSLDDPNPGRDRTTDNSFTLFSLRGWLNMSTVVIVFAGVLTLFVGYPIIAHLGHQGQNVPGFGFGGINGSGQIPDMPNMPRMVDVDTPQSARTRTGTDGHTYNLVFSDEFEKPGRTFWAGDDPFWEAVDLYYWPTVDIE